MDLAVKALAAYRLARLFSREDGPFGMFSKIRLTVNEVSSHSGAPGYLGKQAAALLECPHCLGIWFALLVFILPDWVNTILAISGAQVVIQDFTDYMNTNEGGAWQ